jgi:hypothetical protein
MSDEILRTVLEIKGDTGEIRGELQALKQGLAAHVAEDRAAHGRIAQLELSAANQRGRSSVWHMVAVGAGTAAGYVFHLAIELWKRSNHS